MIKKYNLLVPSYVKKFNCIGADCEDTCCAGWTVAIDKKTYKKYKMVKDKELSEKIKETLVRHKKNSSDDFYAKLKLKAGKCGLLNDNGLCDIHSGLGEEFLSLTCSSYPRITTEINGNLERSMSMSCPEAARLALLSEDGISFDGFIETSKSNLFKNRSYSVDDQNINQWTDAIFEFRYITIKILQSRDYSLDERLLILSLFFNDIEKLRTSNDIVQLPNLFGEYMNLLNNGGFKGEFDTIAPRPDIQLALNRDLVILRLNTFISSERYMQCSREMMEGLCLDKNATPEEQQRIYMEGINQYYTPFIQKYGYIIENYLVNYVFSKTFPIDEKSPWRSFSKMILHYTLIKYHLVGMGVYHKGITSEMSIKVIQSISKVFEHNLNYFNDIMSLLDENNRMSLTDMCILIKS